MFLLYHLGDRQGRIMPVNAWFIFSCTLMTSTAGWDRQRQISVGVFLNSQLIISQLGIITFDPFSDSVIYSSFCVISDSEMLSNYCYLPMNKLLRRLYLPY